MNYISKEELEKYNYIQLYELLELDNTYSNIFKELKVNDDSTRIKDFKLWNETFPNAIGLKCDRSVNSKDLKVIVNNKKLQSLNISRCDNLSNDDVKYICENLKELKKLNITKCENLTDKSIIYIRNNLKLLEDLNLDGCGNIGSYIFGGWSIHNIMSINNLKTLNISNNYNIFFGCMNLCSDYCKKLESLSLTYIEYIPDTFIYAINYMKSLKYLDLHCNLIPNDNFLKLKNENLIHLNISRCKYLNSSCIDHICKYFKKLQSLDISYYYMLNNDNIILISNNLQDLKSLDISHHFIIDANLKWISKLKLTSLYLSNCFMLTDEGIENLINLKDLEVLDLSGCWNLTDKSIIFIC